MSLLDLLQQLARFGPFLYALGVAVPVVIFGAGHLAPHAPTSRVFGHFASSLVALGFLVMAFTVGFCIYLSGKGVDLVTDVPIAALVVPFVFGFGNLWAATQTLTFAQLRTYPTLRRVWSLLMLGALIVAAVFVLKHTFWLVFSGIAGFLAVALLVWSVADKLIKGVAGDVPKEP